jgi:hypothetical protein
MLPGNYSFLKFIVYVDVDFMRLFEPCIYSEKSKFSTSIVSSLAVGARLLSFH